MKHAGVRRVRVTVSLPADLVRRLDKARKKGTPRSRVVQGWLEAADREQRKRKLDEEIRAYYAAPTTEEEEALSKAASRLGSEALAKGGRKGKGW